VVVAVDGTAVDAPGEIGELLQAGGPGASHTLTVERPAGGDTRLDVDVTTIAAEDDPTRAIIGIAPEDRISGFDFPIDVTIDSGTVGGPSAGLAFTLAVLDVLTPGELTGGRRVAVTGTMGLDGAVGPVGGGAQKGIAVRNGGYEVFLVPSDELEEVREAVGDDVEVIAVDTLEAALEALDSLGGDAGTLLESSTADASP
jgi:PDZ domain-containing protein